MPGGLDEHVTQPTPQPMTQPMPQSTPKPSRTVDKVVTVLLLLLMLGSAGVLVLFSAMSVMATDSCGTGGSEPAVCNSDYMATILIGYWAALVGVPILTLVASTVAMVRRRLAWPYAAAGVLVLGLVTTIYVVLLFR